MTAQTHRRRRHNDMDASTHRPRIAPTLSALLVATLVGCSTYRARLAATVGEHVNPMRNRVETSSPLEVYAFFLENTAKWAPQSKGLYAFVPEPGAEPEVPEFLGETCKKVVRFDLPADSGVVALDPVEVPNTVTHVGLIAHFQWHAESDPDERWHLLLPMDGSSAAFRVAGRKLEPVDEDAPPASAPAADEPESSSSTREGQRGTRRSR